MIRPGLEVEVVDSASLTVLILVMNEQLLLYVDLIRHFICREDMNLAIHSGLFLLRPITSTLVLNVESISLNKYCQLAKKT